MAPKKQQKMSIGDFLADQSLGSWADEMDTQPMPAPSSGFGGERRAFSSANSGGFGGDRGGDRGFGSSRAGGFEDRPRMSREQLPLPTRPPYTAHLGNLSFEVTESDVQNFLAGCDVTSVRIVEDKLDRKPKGFGYVEFGTLDGLKKALTLSETQFQGRNVRISVAEPPKDRGEARELNDWTRKGPLPDLPQQQGQGQRRVSERTGSFRGGFDPASDAANDRAPRRGGFPDSDGKPRDFGNWERKGPLSPVPPQEPRQGGRGSRDFGQARERKLSPGWGEGRSDAGSRPPRREFSERPAPERTPTAADQDNQWRARMKPDAPSPDVATPDASVPSSPAGPPKPAERPRLNLAKRTVSEAPEAASASSDSKASPFGAARPIDTSAREREVEEKRQLAIRQKREADDKAREEKKAAAAKSPTDSAAPTPKENGARGSVSERKRSTAQGNDDDEKPRAAQFEILRRMDNGDEGDRDTPDADLNGEIVGDKDTKPREVVREVPKGGDNWRRKDDAAPSPAEDTTADQLNDDGFTVVASNKKGRGNRGARALAS
ncbi:RNA recognition motif-containing protein 6 [Elsinoe fawcettii]|nr:RNA recognition motif-containing protein 6 [Elsinoe fawcettii]